MSTPSAELDVYLGGDRRDLECIDTGVPRLLDVDCEGLVPLLRDQGGLCTGSTRVDGEPTVRKVLHARITGRGGRIVSGTRNRGTPKTLAR